MRSPASFNTSLLLSTWISVACHGGVLLLGFWLCPDPVPTTPPKPMLDHGENAVTIVWRGPLPKKPVPDVEMSVPDEEELPPEEPEPEPVPEPVPEPEPDAKIEAETAPDELEPAEDAPVAEPAPIPATPPLARVESVSTTTPSASPSKEEPVRPATAPARPATARPALIEIVEEGPPSEGNPGVREEASLASRLAPRYPRSCRRRRHEGTVRLECRLNAAGTVDSVRVVSSSGCDRLDRAALVAIRTARFDPARLDGEPVAGTVILPVEFRLR